MDKRSKVKRLNRVAEHRNSMLNSLAHALFFHERIQSTTARVKEARRLAEKLITRARKNLDSATTPERKIHNMRLVGKYIKDKEVLSKLFNDIALRFKKRPGGYTKVIKLGVRNADRSEMAFLELIDRKELAELKEERKIIREEFKNKRSVKKKEPSKEAARPVKAVKKGRPSKKKK